MKKIIIVAAAMLMVVRCLAEEKYGLKKDSWTCWDENTNMEITKEACIPSENECDSCDSSALVQNDCVHVKIPLGTKAPGSILKPGYLMLFSAKPTASMYTPQRLKYVRDYSVTSLSNGRGNGAYGYINMTDPYGSTIRFDFAVGSSIGVPLGGQYYSANRLLMVDAEGWVTTNNPAYYDLHTKQGDLYRFCAAPASVNFLELVQQRDVSGREERCIDRGYETIKDENGILRQVKTPTHLADIVVVGNDSFRVDLYKATQLQSGRDVNGCYRPNSEAVPYDSWAFGNPGTVIKDLRVQRTIKSGVVSSTNTYDFVYTDGVNQWELNYDGAGVSEVKSEEWSDNRSQMLVTVSKIGNNGELAKKEQRQYYMYPWGGAIIKDTLGTGSAALITTYSYYTTQSEVGRYGHIKEKIMPDGSWYSYAYDSLGRIKEEKRTLKDSVLGGAVSVTRVVSNDYASVASGDAILFNDQRPRTVTEKVCGVTVAKTYHAYITNSVKELIEVEENCAIPGAVYGEAGNSRTTRTYFGTNVTNHLIGRLKSVQFSDGKLDTYNYEYGSYLESTNPAESSFTPDSNGESWRETVTHGTVVSPAGVAGKTTREVNVLDAYSQNVLTESYIYTGSTYERITWTVKQFNDFYKPITVYHSNGTQEDTVWAACGCTKQSEKDSAGTEKVYGIDLLNRVVSATKLGTNNLTSNFSYDAADRRISESITDGTGSTAMLVSSNSYDLAGRLTSSVDSLGLTTAYSYQNGGQSSTVVRPGSITNTTENYLDGRTKVTKENGVIKSWHDYGVNADGTTWTKVFSGPAGTNSPMWQKSTADLAGRTIREDRPGYGGTVITNESFYNTKGQLVKTTATGQMTMLYEYNELGEQYRSGLDVNNNGVLDLAGPDRVSETETYYEYGDPGMPSRSLGEGWWKISISKTYAKDGSSGAITNSIQRTQLTGLGEGGLVSFVVNKDSLNNEIISKTIIDRANKTVTQVVDDPDSTNDAVSITVNGLATESTSKTGVKTIYQQDGFGRQIGQISQRTGTNTTHFNSLGQVDYTEDAAGNRTGYAYDPTTGRRISTTDALTNTTYTAYSVEGQVVGTWGATYPVFYEYDTYNRMSAMYTYRGTNSIASYSDICNLKSEMDKTTWLYDQPTGLLTNKMYSDGKGTSYTYTPDGKLLTRTWARGITTTYSYSLCCGGSLTGIDYSDSTPDVAFTYNRIGQHVSITDGTGTRQFTYDNQLRLAAETNVLGQITRTYDSFGRSSGFELSSAMSLSNGLSAVYGFDGVGRFGSLQSTVNGLLANSWDYSFLPGSDLISVISNLQSMITTKSYEQNRNLITGIANKAGTALINQFDYQNDTIGRRTQRIDISAVTNTFGYNIRSEVTSATMGQNQFGYNYDPIGNRISASETTNGVTSEMQYIVNSLNQYTNITKDAVATAPVMDDDGNMVSYKDWTYAWDGENRMIAATNASTVASYAYDYMSRRASKIVNGVTNVFVWDGWNLVSDTTDGVTNYYNWGIDLSGSLQGAGGVGGLLSVIRNGVTYYPVGDANGNITDYVDASGTVVAHREFDAFGNTIVATGPMVHEFHHWFSSKYLDAETGMYYYGHRHFSPEISRWLSRDPIGERGDRNIFRFISNDSINRADFLGLINYNNPPPITITLPIIPANPGVNIPPAPPSIGIPKPLPPGGPSIGMPRRPEKCGDAPITRVEGSTRHGRGNTEQALMGTKINCVVIGTCPATGGGLEDSPIGGGITIDPGWTGMDDGIPDGTPCRVKHICEAKNQCCGLQWNVKWEDGWLYGEVEATKNPLEALDPDAPREKLWTNAKCVISDRAMKRGLDACKKSNAPIM